jgi:predicted dehydrogenase
MSLWLVGAGPIAVEYSKVLDFMNIRHEVIGRGVESAKEFRELTGHHVHVGGLDVAISNLAVPRSAIVAVSVKDLANITCKLVGAGVARILIEKPGGLNSKEILDIATIASLHKSEVFIAYNRRFFSSTKLARELIQRDDGVLSFFFDFTEWAHQIDTLDIDADIKSGWLLANSSHVIDLAFHLCGFPKKINAERSGSLSWHPKSSIFCGSGIADSGALFSYHANWGSPGRWGLEIMTKSKKIIFRPFERLHIVEHGSVQVEQVMIDDELDRKFKPGWYEQTKAFIQSDDSLLCSIAEQMENCVIYDLIAGYSK